MQNTLSIAGRQFRSYWNGPVAYIVAVIVLGFVSFMFWAQFFLAERAVATDMFRWFGYVMVLAAPALTMGLIAEERAAGTIELLLTMPVRESEVIVGKFLSAFGLFLVILFLTALNPILVSTLGDLDWGPVMAGYAGLVLQGAAMIAIGIGISSWSGNQLVAFFLSLFLLAVVGWIVPIMLGFMTTGWVSTTLEFVSLQSHLESMTRGVIDLRDIVFFLSLTLFGLLVAFRALEARRWS